MKVVYAYPVPLPHIKGKVMTYGMARSAVPVYCAMQDGVPTIWMEVKTHDNLERRSFYTCATNEPFEGTRIGSCQDGAFVWHIIEMPYCP